jgi:hypothetical protein
MRRRSQFGSPSGYRYSSYEPYSSNTTPTASQYDLNRNYDETGYIGSPRFIPRSSRRPSSALIPNLSLYEQNETTRQDYGKNNESQYYAGGSLNGFCSECGDYKHLVQCLSHCNIILCEACRNKHWFDEVDDLIKMKVNLEDNVASIRKYLGIMKILKKKECDKNKMFFFHLFFKTQKNNSAVKILKVANKLRNLLQ